MANSNTSKPVDEYSIMLFDGVCNFCSGSVLFALRHLDNPNLRFCPMQSPAGQAMLKDLGFPLDEFETFIFIEKGVVYTKSEGVTRLGKNLTAPWPTLARLVDIYPRGFLDWFYIRVARRRYQIMGKKDQCIVPDAEILKYFIL